MKKRINLITWILIGLLPLSWSSAQESAKTEGQTTALDQNKQLVLRLFEDVFNQQSLAVIDELYDRNVVDHSAFPDQPPGIEGIKSAIKGFFEIFGDFKIIVEDVIAENDRVATREAWRVTHKPSGKTVEGSVMHVFRIHDGKITDEWSRGWNWLEEL